MKNSKSLDEIPGIETMRELVDDVRHPVLVDFLVPIDVSYIADKGMQAVVSLAATLEWNVLRRNDVPVTLVARDGFRTQIPTNTSIKFNVFRAKVYAVFTHSVTAVPTVDLIDRLVKQYKLDPSHAQVFRKVVATGRPVEPEEERSEVPIEPGPGFYEGLVIPEPFQPTERIEQTMAMGTRGYGYVSPLMDTVVRQLVIDGDEQITYRCKICGLEFETKRGVGGHYQVHVKAGDAMATDKLPKEWVKVDVEPEPEPVVIAPWPEGEYPPPVEPEPTPMTDEAEPEPVVIGDDPFYFDPEYVTQRTFVNNKPLVDELLELRATIATIAELIGGDQLALLERQRDEAYADRDRLQQRNDALEQSLGTLHELLGEMREKP